MSRLIVVSNRLPVTLRIEHGEIEAHPSAGGLATALRSVVGGDMLWIGWPGDLGKLSADEQKRVDETLAKLGTRPVHLSAAEVARFYDGFSNGVLWPLFHYLVDKVRLDAHRDWASYRAVNERFAREICEVYKPGDRIWIHDYQLALVPRLVRQRLPDAAIGFFLHIPFPAEPIFRILPWREEILLGLLGADVVGFQTAEDALHFSSSAVRVLGVEHGADTISLEGRRTLVDAFPIGVDAQGLSDLVMTADVAREIEEVRKSARGRKLALSIDRLDYTKGIQRRFLAIERFLEREPALRDKVQFLQLAVPTRERIPAYSDFRRNVHELVGHINGQFGDVDFTPIRYLYRSVPQSKVAAMYAAADVMLVTPLRDGMNLVAKEYLACRNDDTGVLVLSEFAGAAAELTEALLVNPNDVERLAIEIKRAVIMPVDEQRARMKPLRARVFTNDVMSWRDSFLSALDRASGRTGKKLAALAPPDALIRDFARAESLGIALDYDGTLVPFSKIPSLASPDAELIELLTTLASHTGIRLQIVTGRAHEEIDRWFGKMNMELFAEHGLWWRTQPGAEWTTTDRIDTTWQASILPILEDTTRRTSGSHIEKKSASLAWHYRTCEPEIAARRVFELKQKLAMVLPDLNLEALDGSRVLEVRPRGRGKAVAARRLVESLPHGAPILAIGDDVTDEDLLGALPDSAMSIHVGGGPSVARFRLEDPFAVRQLLRKFIQLRFDGGSS
ncbi:MAG: bifunctional alpha,alpha-trehalose-phosphate synthase (UDP-forming)/trehalose-phosphatase [Polyangiaceae bacterium]